MLHEHIKVMESQGRADLDLSLTGLNLSLMCVQVEGWSGWHGTSQSKSEVSS